MSADSLPFRAPGQQIPAAATTDSQPAARGRRLLIGRLLAAPELLGVLAIAAVLNLWNLSVNGMANTYYAAAVKAMSTSWHDFLFASMDKSGLMTVDKPPLALWVEALSARIFGFGSLSMLVPQALMGVAAAGLMYDVVRRRFGRVAGAVAGVVLATTPTIVAVSRHNNPDELLVLMSVLAVWAALRAVDTGRTRYFVLTGVAVGLGFETKMGVALMIVPAIALAWIWSRWDRAAGIGGNIRALVQPVWGGVALAIAGLAWPVLVTLTPASDRPWISGTSDNSVWSLIFGYNGLGRIAGQTGGPAGAGGGGIGGPGGGGGNTLFGGNTGIFRLLGNALGDQAGWLLGFALVAALALLVMTRLRRGDPRTAFLIVIGGSLLTVGVVFSYASGIFHPYYVSMVAPWAAGLVGAGVGEMLPAPLGVAASSRTTRILAPAAIVGGVITELVVLGEVSGLSWATPVLIVAGLGAAAVLAFRLSPRVRAAVLAVAVVALLAAPATWAAETLGHATSGTFPAGGPQSASGMGGPGGGPGGPGGFRGASGAPRGFGAPGPGGFTPPAGGFQGGFTPPTGAARGGFTPPSGGGSFGGESTSLTAAARYVRTHGGGTIAVESQSSAAEAVIRGYDVAGIGGFSGRETTVSAAWIATEVRGGRLRWLLASGGNQLGGLPGDTRTGSASAIAIAERVARKVTFRSGGQTITLYDLQGKASAILAAAAAQ